jgi:hypothetical protein
MYLLDLSQGTSSKIKNLDPWNLFLYISLILLLKDKKSEFLISTPSVGINSPHRVCEVFKGNNIIIDTKGKEVSLHFAVFLGIFLTPFIETCAMTIKAVTAIEDPINPSYQKTSGKRSISG